MATLRRYHAPQQWGARVDRIAWDRLQEGKHRRPRGNRPPLTYEPGWDWDGTKVVHDKRTAIEDWEDRDCDCQEESRESNIPLSRRQLENVSLFDVAGYPVEERKGKGRATALGEFEIVRLPRVVHILEDEQEIGSDWERLDEWEKVEVTDFKRSYSEVIRIAIELEGKDPPR